MTRRDFPEHKNATRGDATPSRSTKEDAPSMAAGSNIPDRAEVLEAADHGHLQELAMWNAIVGFAQVPEPAPLHSELARLLSLDLREMRERLIDDMKMLDANRDQAGVAELHIRVGSLVDQIDEMAAVLRREIGVQE